MNNRSFSVLTLFALLLTAMSLIGHRLLPPKKYDLLKHEIWWPEFFKTYDVSLQEVTRPLSGSLKDIQCEGLSGDRKALCGINFFYGELLSSGLDLSSYDRLVLKAKYSGGADRVRIFMRNFNTAYSVEGDPNSGKFVHLALETNEFTSGEPVVIDLEQFAVADWWLNQRKLERHQLPVEFSNITTFGFSFSEFLPTDGKIAFEIEGIVFEGERVSSSTWYLGIILFWMSVLFVYAGSKVVLLIREKKYFERESEKYKQLSNLDALTGISNRNGVERSLEKILNAHMSQTIGIILVDIDHFKSINDYRGHDVGDLVLKAFAKIIKENIRSGDVFGRWGGEEFILIMPNLDENSAWRVAEKLRRIIAAYDFVEEDPLVVTASFGVAILNKGEDFTQILKFADEALYEAKGAGRNCVIKHNKS